MSHPNSETLAAYWLGELPEAEVLSLEEHLFACERCTKLNARMAALPRALAFAVPPVVTREQAARLQQLDARIQRVVVPPGGRGVADFSSGVPAQLIVLAAAAPGAVSVNITLCARDGTPVRTKEAVPFDAASGEVIVACRDYYVMDETLPRAATFQVEATGPGGERTTRKFDVDHVLPV